MPLVGSRQEHCEGSEEAAIIAWRCVRSRHAVVLLALLRACDADLRAGNRIRRLARGSAEVVLVSFCVTEPFALSPVTEHVEDTCIRVALWNRLP